MRATPEATGVPTIGPPMAGLAAISGIGALGARGHGLILGRGAGEGVAPALIAGAFAQHAAQAQDHEHGNDAEEDQIQILKAAAHGSPDQFRPIGGHLGDSRLAGPRRMVALDGGR